MKGAQRVTMVQELEACKALLRWFCVRVERGDVRSVRTVRVFREALRGRYREAIAQAREITPDLPEVF